MSDTPKVNQALQDKLIIKSKFNAPFSEGVARSIETLQKLPDVTIRPQKLICSYSGEDLSIDKQSITKFKDRTNKEITCILNPRYESICSELVPVICKRCSTVVQWAKPHKYKGLNITSGQHKGTIPQKGEVNSLHIPLCKECIDEMCPYIKEGVQIKQFVYEYLLRDCDEQSLDFISEANKRMDEIKKHIDNLNNKE